jgi:hypothetical protein
MILTKVDPCALCALVETRSAGKGVKRKFDFNFAFLRHLCIVDGVPAKLTNTHT